MRKFLKKNFWSHGTPLGYLGSLSWDPLVEFFQNSMGLFLQGLEVTSIPVSPLENFGPLRGYSVLMCPRRQSLTTKMVIWSKIPFRLIDFDLTRSAIQQGESYCQYFRFYCRHVQIFNQHHVKAKEQQQCVRRYGCSEGSQSSSLSVKLQIHDPCNGHIGWALYGIGNGSGG